jgi:Fatty acid desaturase
MANPGRYATDLLADGDLRLISRTFPVWVAVGLALPFGLGIALTGSVVGGLTGLLWGGAVRIFLLHHATFSINSLCHCFGRRPFATGDQSHNLAWLAPLAFGEAWHNNHHAFPTSARHGLGRRQLDPSAWLITGLEHCHLAWDVVRMSPNANKANADPRRRDASGCCRLLRSGGHDQPRAARLGVCQAVSGVARIGAGMSAAPAMTRQNARKRAVMARGPEPIGSWKTRMPPMIAARLAATEVSAMTSTPSPSWRLRAEA